MDIDPWQEAAELTRLSRDSAIQRLAALLVRVPGRPNGLPDAEMTAMRLVALLPARNNADHAVPAQIANPGRAFDPTFVAIGFGFVVVVLLSGFFQATNEQAAAQTDGKPAAASSVGLLAASHPIIRR
jgi:hypothetical protein